MLYMHKIEARDLPDLWFQAVYDILDHGRRFTIDRGSYAGQTRLEYDYFTGHVRYPGTQPILPDMPPACGIPAPVEEAYIYGGEGYERSYIEYLMTDRKEPTESYTYGERLVAGAILYDKDLYAPYDIYGGEVDQIQTIINIYKKHGHRNNQMILQIGQPGDILIEDPPCLRHIDTRIQDDTLHFFVYFRSWDLWGGLPANLAAIQNLKEHMAGEIGVKDGEMIVESKGLHLYGYAEDLAKLRCLRE
jgi:thymidylate synthase